MSQNLSLSKIIDKIFIATILMASLTGIGYFVYCYKNSIVCYFAYTDAVMNAGGVIAYLIRYSKDILTVILIILLILKSIKLKKMKILIFFLLFTIYGFLIGLFNGLGIIHAFSGVRSMMYFLAFVLYFNKMGVKKEIIYSVYKYTKIILILQGLSILLEVFKSGVNYIGYSSYRYIGLFLSSGTLANYSYAVSLFISICFLKLKIGNTCSTAFFECICLFLSIASNSRLCIAGIIVNILITFTCNLKLKQNEKNIIIIIITIVLIPTILTKVIENSHRGGLEMSASGKISFWQDAFNNYGLLNIIFGNGLGYATQTTAILNATNTKYSGFDGTFSVFMAQFGLIGVILLAFCSIYIFVSLINKSKFRDISFKINVIGGMFIFMLCGNIFENILMCLYFVYIYYILIDNNLEKSKQNF